MRLVASITASGRLILRAGVVVAATFAGGLLLNAENTQVPSGTWEDTGSTSEARSGASAALLLDGHVLVTGGITPAAVSASAERYSLGAESFLSTPAMHEARANHVSTVLADGRVLVTGGTGVDGLAMASAELYDPAANVWLAVGSLSVARSNHTATRLANGKVLVAGGDDEGVPNATLEVFDPAHETFAVVDGALSAPRSAHAAVRLADGRVLIIGGHDGEGVLASVDVYDPMSATVAPGPSLGTSRAGHSATLLLNGRVLVAGGAGVSGEIDSAEIFNPVMNTFQAAGSVLVAPRQHHLAFLLPHNNTVLIVGGTSGNHAVATAELFVPWQGSYGTFVATGLPAAARAWAVGASLSGPANDTVRTGPADGLLLLVGGSASTDGSSPMTGAELYGFATVNTNAADYAPGQKVTITGSGWRSGEVVTLSFYESPSVSTHPALTVRADGAGRIFSEDFVADELDLNIRIYVTATGAASQARTTFTATSIPPPPPVEPLPAPTTTTVTSVPLGSSVFGETVVFTATVAPPPGTGIPNTVTFKDGDVPLGSSSVNPTTGRAVLATTVLALGSHEITAVFDGNASFAVSTSPAITHTVTGSPTTTTLTSSPNPSVYGQEVTLRARVVPVAPGAPRTLAFQPPAVYDAGTGTATYSTAVGDFNADGFPDLATTSRTTNEVSIALGDGSFLPDGTGGFGTPVLYPVGTVASPAVSPVHVLAVDLDGDGILDLVTANQGSANVSVLKGNSDGTFAAPLTFTTGLPGVASPGSVAVGDFNHDLKLDLAIMNASTDPVAAGQSTVTIRLGDGMLGFGTCCANFGVLTTPAHIVAADFNHDGFPDIATANAGGNTVSIRVGTATGSPSLGTLTSFTMAGAGTSPRAVVVGDFNSDGKTDFATANFGSTTAGGSVSVRLNTGVPGAAIDASYFGAVATTVSLGTSPDANLIRPDFMVGGDFNGDGTLDLAVSDSNHSFVSILTGSGTGAFASPVRFDSGASGRRLAAADLNGDGTLDLAMTPTITVLTPTNHVHVLLNIGTTPTGFVQFMDAGDPLGAPVAIDSFGFATKLISTLAVGSHPLRAEYLGDATYDGSFGDHTHVVNRAPLTVTADNTSRTYGGADPTFTASYSGFVLGQDSSVLGGALTLTTPATSASDVGTYSITPGGLTSDNYEITFVDGTLTVNQALLTVTAANASRAYGDANPTFTAIYSGFVLGQDSSVLGGALTFTTPATTASGVGTYAITPSGLTSSNYAIAFVDGALTIDRALLTVTADDASRPFGTPNPPFTASYSGFVNGEILETSGVTGQPALTTTAVSTSPVGTYPITAAVGTLAAANYDFTFVNGTLNVVEITAPVLKLTKSVDKTIAYPGDTLVYTLTYSNTGNGAATGVTISDLVPVHTTFVSASHGGTNVAGTARWTIGNVAVGASGSVTLTVLVSSAPVCRTDDKDGKYDRYDKYSKDDRGQSGHRHDDGDQDDKDHRSGQKGHHRGDGCSHDAEESCTVSVLNKGSIRSVETPTSTLSNIVTTIVKPRPVPVLSLRKAVNRTTAAAGDTLVYTLTYSNTGQGAATGATISDAIPADTTFVSASHGGTNAAGTVSWTIGNVAAGASGSVTLTVRVSTTLACRTDDKSDKYGSYSSGQSSHKHGDDDQDDKDHRSGQKGHYSGDRCSHDGDGGGQAESCTVSVTNQGAIRSVETPTSTPSNTVTTTVKIIAAPRLVPVMSLRKAVNRTTAVAGDTLVYTLTYSNTGKGAATGVKISDVVPANTTFVSASHGGTNAAGTVSWTIGNVAAGASGSVTLTVRVSTTLACRTDDKDGKAYSSGSSHKHGDGDQDDQDHRSGQKGHKRGDGCSHDDDEGEEDEDCTVSVTNQGAIRSIETPSPDSSNTVTTQVTVQSEGTKGRMTGGGTFGTQKAHHGFTLNCDPKRGSNNLEVNWGNGDKFHLETVTSASCVDDPRIGPSRPSASFDTYRGTGVGRYNGTRATVEWTFTDAGEPGNRDTATVVIKNSAGRVVLSATGSISNGNHQSH